MYYFIPPSLVKGYRFVNKKRICFRIPCSWSSKKISILLYYYHTLLFMDHLKAAGMFCWVITWSAIESLSIMYYAEYIYVYIYI